MPVDPGDRIFYGRCATKFMIQRQFFEKIKESFALAAEAIVGVAQNGWSRFLKCIDLYSQGLLRRSDLVPLLAKLFSSCGLSIDFLDSLNKMLHDKGSSLVQSSGSAKAGDHKYLALREGGRDRHWGISMALHDMDFSCCKHGTPSYRALPASIPRQSCGEQISMLNDVWVSQPVGSKGPHLFPHVWKHENEDELFSCEDERYEFDMILNANAAAIKVLGSLMSHMKRQDYDSGDCSLRMMINMSVDVSLLSSAHLRPLLHLYGKRSAELIELLYKHPQSTIPTILKRLKQKGLEWIRIRESFVKKHKEQVARISFCTMDYSACNFRQDDRVKIMPRCLVQDIFALNHSQIEVSRLGDVSGTRRPAMMQKVTGGPDDANAENTALPKMVLKLGRPCIHNNLFHLIYTAIERSSMSEHNKFLVAKFWHHFFAHFLNLPKEVTMTVPNDPRTQTHVKDVHASAGSNNVELNSELATHDPKTEYHKRADVKMGSAVTTFNGRIAKSGLIICTREMYTFFRLYHLLFQRFEFVYRLCEDCHKDLSAAYVTNSQNESPRASRIEALLSIVHGFVGGNLEAHHYREGCQLLLGTSSFVFSTVDRLTVLILKQLEQIVNDALSHKLLELWKGRETQKYHSHANPALHLGVSAQFPSLLSLESYTRLAVQCLENVSVPLFAVEYQADNIRNFSCDSLKVKYEHSERAENLFSVKYISTARRNGIMKDD
jgi:paired amphipathic helix protein Sin3a